MPRRHPKVWPYDEPERSIYWALVEQWATQMEPPSDGCSKVKDFYVEACWEHDIHYRYGRKLLLVAYGDSGYYTLRLGEKIKRAWGDQRFKRAVRSLSWLAWLSPMALWRYFIIVKAGQRAWDDHRAADPQEQPRMVPLCAEDLANA